MVKKKEELNQKSNMYLMFNEIGKEAEKLRKTIKAELEEQGLDQFKTDLGNLSIVSTTSTSVDMDTFNQIIEVDKRYMIRKLYDAGVLVPNRSSLEEYAKKIGDDPSRYLISTQGTRLDSKSIVKIPNTLYNKIFDVVYNLVVEELLKKIR